MIASPCSFLGRGFVVISDFSAIAAYAHIRLLSSEKILPEILLGEIVGGWRNSLMINL
jgi:hypothetical protein